jgi:hypothetical protein
MVTFAVNYWEELSSVRYGMWGGDADATSPWRFIVSNIHIDYISSLS